MRTAKGKGLTIYGGGPGGALELTFPLNIDLTIIQIAELYLALRAQGGPVTAEAALSGRADIGPIHGFVQRVGLRVIFDSSGTRLGFCFPDGFGMSIDAGPVTGGGYLFNDDQRRQYAGGLQLKLQTISITAIGLLTTKMPDGSPIPALGFSLLLITPSSSRRFSWAMVSRSPGSAASSASTAPRGARASRRRAQPRAGLDPLPPIRSRTRRPILSGLRCSPSADRYVFGPMVLLAWGTPTHHARHRHAARPVHADPHRHPGPDQGRRALLTARGRRGDQART